jgi:nitrite reductase/ring-hydroxylating ferredoxin subunit
MQIYFEAARVGEIQDRCAKTVEVQGKKIAIVRVDGGYHAVDALCTHMGVPLSKGSVDGDHLVCPWHAARFCVKTGRKKSGPGWCDLQTYPVRVSNGAIEIAMTVDAPVPAVAGPRPAYATE